MIFESENIDGIDYIDGGIVDNVPIEPVYYEKCDLIIVVGLMGGYRVDRNIYSESQILEIIPSEMEEGFIDGALNFTEENSKQRMEVGYNDTINQIKPIINLLTYINNRSKKPSIIESFKELFRKVQ